MLINTGQSNQPELTSPLPLPCKNHLLKRARSWEKFDITVSPLQDKQPFKDATVPSVIVQSKRNVLKLLNSIETRLSTQLVNHDPEAENDDRVKRSNSTPVKKSNCASPVIPAVTPVLPKAPQSASSKFSDKISPGVWVSARTGTALPPPTKRPDEMPDFDDEISLLTLKKSSKKKPVANNFNPNKQESPLLRKMNKMSIPVKQVEPAPAQAAEPKSDDLFDDELDFEQVDALISSYDGTLKLNDSTLIEKDDFDFDDFDDEELEKFFETSDNKVRVLFSTFFRRYIVTFSNFRCT